MARSNAMAKTFPINWRHLAALATITGLALSAPMAKAEDETIIKTHGYNFYGHLSYPEDFSHFNYVNPEAPKGGEIAISASGTFDSMNPFTRKGRAGALSWTIYESLLGDGPSDVYGESYGNLAHTVEYNEGKNWAIFYMRPEARFSDGSPVTAHDVVFSHNLFLEQGLPSYAQAVKKRIWSAEAIDDHTVKFTFNPEGSRRSLVSQVGAVSVFSKKWYEETGARMDESRLEVSPGSGPYVIDTVDVNRRIVYKRNPDYWGWHLPRNVGRFNFDTIRIEYFADTTASFEAFKAGEYNFREETSSKQWSTSYDFPAVDKGHVVRETLADGSPPVPSGFIFNLRRDIFDDPKVREALSLGYNFEWTNASLQFGVFQQRHSFVQNQPTMAEGLPEGAELEFLKSLGDIVPETMFTEPAVLAHSSNLERQADRRNIRKAMRLLDEAGWEVGDDGLRRDAQGRVFEINMPMSSSSSPTLSAIAETYAQNLERIGVKLIVESIDPAQFTLRRRDFDYDILFSSYASFLGTGTGLRQRYGSAEAAISVFNPAGLASPMVDAIIDASLETKTVEDQDVTLMALDRALRHERFMIHTWYRPTHWVAYYDMFEHPEELPRFDLGYLDFWWFNQDKFGDLKSSGALR